MGSCCASDTAALDLRNTEELLSVNHLSIRIVTWNVGSQSPDKIKSIDKLLQPEDGTDIIVVGLQEIIDITKAKNLLTRHNEEVEQWDDAICNALNCLNASTSMTVLDTYSKLSHVILKGILLFVFAKNTIYEKIDAVECNKVGAGLFGIWYFFVCIHSNGIWCILIQIGIGPNKGAVAIRFTVFNTSICFVCAHLAAHKDKVKVRNDNFNKIMNKLKFSDHSNEDDGNEDSKNDVEEQSYHRLPSHSHREVPKISIDSHDLIFFFGDLNYRLDADNEVVYELIRLKKWNNLLLRDQLMTAIAERKAFLQHFEEHQIEFRPTYKYIQNGSGYDKLSKRTPSYCDRILWRMSAKKRMSAGKKLECLMYRPFNKECMSDHKPVAGLFEIKCPYKTDVIIT